MKGSVVKRCSCPPAYDAKGNRRACKLAHGSWAYVADVGRDPVTGKRRQVRKSGYRTKGEAEQQLAELLNRSNTGRYVDDARVTVAGYLATWLDAKIRNGLRASTARSYRQHIDDYLVPQLGRLRLRDLRPQHVSALLEELDDGRRGPATRRRVHATLRSALSSAVREQLITWNPAKGVELPTAPRPRVRPWEPAELAAFLDHAMSDRLGAAFEVAAFAGLRRGELLGLRWDDVDLEAGTVTVRRQIVQQTAAAGAASCPFCDDAHTGLAFGSPKTASGEDRVVDLDPGTAGSLMAHRLDQDAGAPSGAPGTSSTGSCSPARTAPRSARPISPNCSAGSSPGRRCPTGARCARCDSTTCATARRA